MRSVFNLGLFKEQLREELSVFEFSFIKRVFTQSAFGFSVFGLLVCSLTALIEAGQASSVFSHYGFGVLGGILALFSGLALMFYYLPKYHSNPLEVTPKFVKRAYFCLICTYGIVFCGLFKALKLLAVLGDNKSFGWMSSSMLLGVGLFGTTLLVYAIPVLIGLGMKKHSSALKLSRFLRTCYIAYLVLFLIGLVATLAVSSDSTYRMYNFLMVLLSGVIIFTAPVLTVYRMKTVIKYLDQTDMVAIKKWELFFVFEALTQLMQMAVYLVRLLCSLCAGSIYSSSSKD
ncbi:hypothetical protein DNK47_02250 [Mycoplasma wenyonii]|uniref:Uncharacterized protein n=1 Tax=Mycoplasma wenyonii TaxID=65123 RepID=A0A328PPQ6_9MOLU|nr:hypothetical protein [Mycoplasma wenyonii]RAO94948.1 hypothetical protein DNK47_02250 [Mycoplasma wenyonii]